MFKFDREKRYMMPPHFGPMPEGTEPACYRDCQSFSLVFESTIDALEQYIPEDFELSRPEVEIRHFQCQAVDWMGGDGYNMLAVNVPVHFKAENLDGIYNLVLWENATEPILIGRETNGVPKIFADITDLSIYQNRIIRAAVSHRGLTFLTMNGEIGRRLTDEDRNQHSGMQNMFAWRCFPNIGRPGLAISHPVLFPLEQQVFELYEVDSNVQWTALRKIEHPTQYHIITALSELPFLRTIASYYMKMQVQLHVELCRELPTKR
ncbi:MAG: acetoacetate decarboxylase family protein [Planctomycetia bacterium]|nr:acetoacetate decarboxylase family protein [Planctomycetia bacterium]